MRRTVQQLSDFLVSGLGEILIPLADRKEGLRSFPTDDLVNFAAKLVARVLRSDRHGDRYGLRLELAQCTHGRPHARTSSQSVIDQNTSVVDDFGWLAVSTIELFAPIQFHQFLR